MTKKKQEPILNWRTLLEDVNLLCLCVITVNSINMAGKEFSWVGLGVLLSGLGLVGILLYMKHLNWDRIK